MNESIKRAVVRLAQWADEHWQVKRVFVIGSAVRGDTHEKSDLDILVDFGDTAESMVDRIIFDEQDWTKVLKELVEPIANLPASIHANANDLAWDYVKEGRELFSYRKVRVVRTKPKPN